MPEAGVLVALCASRSGTDAWTYFHTRTEGQFTLDTLAWFASWGTPATVLMGGGKGGKGKGGEQGLEVKQNSSGGRDRRINIDAFDTPDRIGHLYTNVGLNMPTAQTATVTAWEKAVRARAKKVDLTKKGPPRAPR